MLKRTLIVSLCILLMLASGCTGPATAAPVESPPEASPTAEAPTPAPTPTPTATPEPSVSPPAADDDSGGTPPETSPTVEFKFTADNMPRLDGSTANIPLGQMVLMALLGQTAEQSKENITFNGTSKAWENLVNGDTDVLLVYEPAEETQEYLDSMPTEYEKAPIGRDALVFLVNTKNKADNLTTQQLRDIYTGKTTNWKQVGGDSLPILAYQRNATSGSQALMEKLVMNSIVMAEAPTAMVIGEMGGLVDAVAQYDNAGTAIGYNVYYYVSQMKNDPNIKLLSIDGIAPANESIQAGEYPFVNDFYAAIRADEPEDSPARVLFNWLQGEQGQQLVKNAGYVSVR